LVSGSEKKKFKLDVNHGRGLWFCKGKKAAICKKVAGGKEGQWRERGRVPKKQNWEKFTKKKKGPFHKKKEPLPKKKLQAPMWGGGKCVAKKDEFGMKKKLKPSTEKGCSFCGRKAKYGNAACFVIGVDGGPPRKGCSGE